jgi:hypothetical protein
LSEEPVEEAEKKSILQIPETEKKSIPFGDKDGLMYVQSEQYEASKLTPQNFDDCVNEPVYVESELFNVYRAVEEEVVLVRFSTFQLRFYVWQYTYTHTHKHTHTHTHTHTQAHTHTHTYAHPTF